MEEVEDTDDNDYNNEEIKRGEWKNEKRVRWIIAHSCENHILNSINN